MGPGSLDTALFRLNCALSLHRLGAMANKASSQCVSCGSVLAGEYCHDCGERARRAPPTLLRFIGELISEAVDADGRIVKSIRMLIMRPGRLTVEYMRGRRKPDLGPAAVFVVMNVLFFFTQPLADVNTFTATLQSQTNWYPYSPWAEAKVTAHLEESGRDRSVYAQEFDLASERYARTLIFVQVPLFALGVMLVEIAKRRFFIEHLVYATHFFAALLLLGVVTSILIYAYWQLGLGNQFNLEIPFLLFIVAYAAVSLRTVYDDGWLSAGIKGILLLIVCIAVIQVYRFVLFVVTFWTVP